MFKKLLLLPFFAFIFAGSAHAIDGFITITNPNGGTFTEGDTVNITWTSSPNIDQVNIGYKSCPSCLDWVVFTTPNTGSYSWHVDVGNTTNTQFYLQITGYETGQGSITSNSGTFTVNQNPPLNSGSTSSSPTPNPNNSNGNNNNGNKSPSPTPAVYNYMASPTPTPKPLTPRLTIYTLILWSEFTFEGSQTTNLKDINDPAHVENFTLDTQEGYTFVFADELNLTDPKTLAGLQNTEKYWEYEVWFVWIKWEWWVTYDIEETINVEYKNDNLTGYAPTLSEETKPSPAPLKGASPVPRKAPAILGAEAGKVTLAVNDGTPVKIVPHVTLDGEEVFNTSKTDVTITGHTSHNNLTYQVKVNGETRDITPELDKDSGKLTFTVNGLISGANSLRFFYKDGDSDPVSFGDKTVILGHTRKNLIAPLITALLAVITLTTLTLLTPRFLPKIKKLLKKNK